MLSFWRILCAVIALEMVLLLSGSSVGEVGPFSPEVARQSLEKAVTVFEDEGKKDLESFSELIFALRVADVANVVLSQRRPNETDAEFGRRNHRRANKLIVGLIHDYPALAKQFVQKFAGEDRFPYDEVIPLLLRAEAYDLFKLVIETAKTTQHYATTALNADMLFREFLHIKDPNVRRQGLQALSEVTQNNPFTAEDAPLLKSAHALTEELVNIGGDDTEFEKRALDLVDEIIDQTAKTKPAVLKDFLSSLGEQKVPANPASAVKELLKKPLKDRDEAIDLKNLAGAFEQLKAKLKKSKS